nr:MAG TPA: hypothetical protein [Caudoviricetes sp.]
MGVCEDFSRFSFAIYCLIKFLLLILCRTYYLPWGL